MLCSQDCCCNTHTSLQAEKIWELHRLFYEMLMIVDQLQIIKMKMERRRKKSSLESWRYRATIICTSLFKTTCILVRTPLMHLQRAIRFRCNWSRFRCNYFIRNAHVTHIYEKTTGGEKTERDRKKANQSWHALQTHLNKAQKLVQSLYCTNELL